LLLSANLGYTNGIIIIIINSCIFVYRSLHHVLDYCHRISAYIPAYICPKLYKYTT